MITNEFAKRNNVNERQKMNQSTYEARPAFAGSRVRSGKTLPGSILGRILRPALAAAIMVAGSAVVSAQVTNTVDETTIANFGTLNQLNVGGAMYCVPTATMNSFTWLQNAYPGVYGLDGTGAPVLQGGTGSWLAAAQLLASAQYMNTSALNGTSEDNWAIGKANYLNQFAPGKTTFVGMDANADQNRPNWDQKADPTIAFLLGQLRAGEDVEIAIFPSTDIGHVLTLTGMTWVDAQSGVFTIGDPLTLDTIDPANPNQDTTLVIDPESENNPAGGNPMGIMGANYDNYILTGALAESPVPEPATITLALLGGASFLLRRRNA
jgi:hypothetical protein